MASSSNSHMPPPPPNNQSLPLPPHLASFPAVSYQETAPMSKEQLDPKSKKWIQFQARKYADKQLKTMIAICQLDDPTDFFGLDWCLDVRKIIKDRGDLSNRKFRIDKRVHLDALEYVPLASDAKRDRRHFNRMCFPPFDDKEPPLDYGDNILDTKPSEAIQMYLDEDEDTPVFDWLHDHKPPAKKYKGVQYVNGTSYKSWQLNLGMMSTLTRIGRNLISDFIEDNYFYLFEQKAFFTVKAMNMAIPGGRLSSLSLILLCIESYDDEWNEFNNINKVIIRQQIRTKYCVAFPHLHNSRPRSVHIPKVSQSQHFIHLSQRS
ncbi:uncharacterized protein MELLADRAFT_84336 [Melampsora larici-populina 98AG31]|uniref:PRO8NT domain-containing protein n=1 Tax=Melampsora larici-populina (strain 98AG31 / pathotype 3-4-7) TaxID=747676 RepID=F4RFD6_MELLP|nr:uncharacterized protein MELLADRAFT_84336 [Melampsora larici-populina 98AG31]EGG08954.1 hypothetical protein MELLADRAFT_84336 [Melampsora larici-populina 98AG31]